MGRILHYPFQNNHDVWSLVLIDWDEYYIFESILKHQIVHMLQWNAKISIPKVDDYKHLNFDQHKNGLVSFDLR
jgi:hypothetical protein